MKTKKIVLTGLLTAIAIIIPMIVPVKVVIPPFSATLTAHVPLIIAMFIGPYSAVFAALGSALGFTVAMSPVIGARAAVHVFFVVIGSLMIKKKCNIFLVGFVTMVVHAASEMLIVYLLFTVFGMDIIGDRGMSVVQSILAIGVSIHHIIDFAIALVIYKALAKNNKII